MAILLIDKPKGITSFDVIRRLRWQLGITKMGHAGTLDPLASGLMIIGTETDTKRLNEFLRLDKSYEAEIIVGEKRNTGDLEGEIIEECDVSDLDELKVQRVLQNMQGVLELPVPRHSAVKQGGVALYKKARRGEEVKVPKKEMRVLRAELKENSLVQLTKPNRIRVTVLFSVGSGTYIRSLAEEFGERLGYPATLGNLRRTRVGEFSVEDARSI